MLDILFNIILTCLIIFNIIFTGLLVEDFIKELKKAN